MNQNSSVIASGPTTVHHQLGILESRQVGGNPWLSELRDGGELGHAQFFLFQAQQEAQPGAVREQPQVLRGELKVHGFGVYIFSSRLEDI